MTQWPPAGAYVGDRFNLGRLGMPHLEVVIHPEGVVLRGFDEMFGWRPMGLLRDLDGPWPFLVPPDWRERIGGARAALDNEHVGTLHAAVATEHAGKLHVVGGTLTINGATFPIVGPVKFTLKPKDHSK